MTLVSIEKQITQQNSIDNAAPRQGKSALTNQAACWRIVVLPPKIPSENSVGAGPGGVRLRMDRPHAIKAPKLPLNWSSDVGFHRRVSDNISTVSPSGFNEATLTTVRIEGGSAPLSRKVGEIERFEIGLKREEKAKSVSDVVRAVRSRRSPADKVAGNVPGTINSIAVQNKIAAGLQPSLGRRQGSLQEEGIDQKVQAEMMRLPAANPEATAVLANDRVIRRPDDYKKLLTEAAHDIRSPIATASQILRTISNRVRAHGQLTRGEVELLDQANLRLVQANDWAEGILLDRRLEYGRPLPVRKRFYPMQLQTSIRPLLESIASRRSVNLAWNGWERSLPKLYLDANHLSRVMMNLVSNAVDASIQGQLVSINVDWHKTICQPLQISVADQAGGLSPELMQQLNSPYMPQGDDDFASRGIGLKTTKALVASMAGTLSAQRRQPKGSLLRVSLPIDNPMSLVRSWLTRNTLRAHEHHSSQNNSSAVRKVFVAIDLVRVRTLDLEFADSQLQLAAFENELPYRVAQDRWLWIAMRSANKSMPYSLDRTAKRLNDLQGRESEACRVLQVFRTSEFNPDDLQGPNLQSGRMLSVIDAIVTKVAQLIGDNVPVIDQLAPVESPVIQRSSSVGNGAFSRMDARSSHKPNLALLGGGTQVEASDELTAALKQLAEHWHKTQGKLDRSGAERPTAEPVDAEFEMKRGPHSRTRGMRAPN